MATKLASQLDEQSRLFLSNQTKGVLIGESTLKVSEIFKWFTKDFGSRQGVKAFIENYLPKAKNKKIEDYFDYNWSLNSQ